MTKYIGNIHIESTRPYSSFCLNICLHAIASDDEEAMMIMKQKIANINKKEMDNIVEFRSEIINDTFFNYLSQEDKQFYNKNMFNDFQFKHKVEAYYLKKKMSVEESTRWNEDKWTSDKSVSDYSFADPLHNEFEGIYNNLYESMTDNENYQFRFFEMLFLNKPEWYDKWLSTWENQKYIKNDDQHEKQTDDLYESVRINHITNIFESNISPDELLLWNDLKLLYIDHMTTQKKISKIIKDSVHLKYIEDKQAMIKMMSELLVIKKYIDIFDDTFMNVSFSGHSE